jgi:hypothetical protein
MRNFRRLEAALVAAIFLSACSTSRQVPAEKTVDATTSSAGSATAIASVRLVPQPEGTPLPPRDPRIADHWPPEFKQMIDNLLSLYLREGKPPSVKEVEEKMGITLTERPLTDGEFDLYKRYTVSGTRYMNPSLEKYGGLGERYAIRRSQSPGGMTQHLRLVTSRPQSGFCLDPYELAVYTGSKFVNGDTSPHAAPRFWPAAYVWGVFEWSATSRYVGENFSVVIGQNRDPKTRKVLGAGCVAAITVLGRYIKE